MAERLRRRRRPGRLVAVLVMLAGSLLALEGAVRARQWLRYGIAGDSYYSFVDDAVTGLRIPEPGVTRGRDRTISVNSRSFRGPELDVPKPAGRVRVACLGASTTFCAEASGDEATWPALLTDGLRRAFPDRDFDLVNAGVAGYTTRQSLLTLQHRVAPLAPDIVVIYHATNDLSHDTRQLAQQRGLVGAERSADGWLVRNSLAWQILDKNLPALLPWGRDAAGTADGTLVCDFAPLADGFRTRLTELVAAARQAGAHTVVLVSFSHRQRREQPPEERRLASATSTYWMPYLTVDAILDGFEHYNAAVRAAAAESAALLVEGELSIPGDGLHFADSVHFTDAGCAAQAARVLDTLLAREALDWLRKQP